MNLKVATFTMSFYVVLVVGCAPTPTNTCVPGEQVRCACNVGESVQTCQDDGTFGVCSCEDVSIDSDAGSQNDDDSGVLVLDAGSLDAGNMDAGYTSMDAGVTADAGEGSDDDAGQLPPIVVPPGSGHRVAQGDRVSCWIDSEDHVKCYGSDVHRRASPPAGLYGALVMGDYFGCALNRSGRIQCWGDDTFGQQQSPTGIFTHLAAGARHMCALRSDSGRAECWGDFTEGQGNANSLSYVVIAAGPEHTCALLAEGVPVCWGQNRWGQASAPTNVIFTQLALSENTSCGITINQQVACWGSPDEATTHPPSGEFTAITAGDAYFCALDTDERVVCWGNIGGTPTGNFSALASGKHITCAYQRNGTRRCFGENGAEADIPMRPSNIEKMYVTTEHVCQMTTTKDLLCLPRDGVVGTVNLSRPGPWVHMDVAARVGCGSKTGLDFSCVGDIEMEHFFSSAISTLAIDRGELNRVLVQIPDELMVLDEGSDVFVPFAPSSGVVFDALKVHSDTICGLSEGRVYRHAAASPDAWSLLYEAGDIVEIDIADGGKCCWLDNLGVVSCEHLANPLAFDEDLGHFDMHANGLTGVALHRETSDVIDLEDGASFQLAPGPYREAVSVPSLTCAVHDEGTALCWGLENMRLQ